MSGHSKWSTIKHKKAANDAKRSKMFTKYLKEITVASKLGGGDIEMNPRLRLAVLNAKKQNVPKDNIQKAINKGAGGGGENFEEITYEGYASNGVALFLECLTDNTKRTIANVRSILRKGGGTIGTNGSVSFMFERKGVFTLKKPESLDTEELELELIDAGLEEIEEEGDSLVLTCPLQDFGNLSNKLEELKLEPDGAEADRIPSTTVKLDLPTSLRVLNLISNLEDDDDVQKVFHNLEMTDELMESMS